MVTSTQQQRSLLLKLLRDSGGSQKVVAPAGQFQQNLPQGRTFQLLRLRMDPALNLIPEISGNRLMFSVRLMRQGEDNRLHAAAEDASFELEAAGTQLTLEVVRVAGVDAARAIVDDELLSP